VETTVKVTDVDCRFYRRYYNTAGSTGTKTADDGERTRNPQPETRKLE
jgi:hypothetical protein